MKKFITLILIASWFITANAQYYIFPNSIYGIKWYRIKADSALNIPTIKDTAKVQSIDTTNLIGVYKGKFYYYFGHKWNLAGGGGSINPNSDLLYWNSIKQAYTPFSLANDTSLKFFRTAYNGSSTNNALGYLALNGQLIVGSQNASNNRNAIQAYSYTGIPFEGTTYSGPAFRGHSTNGDVFNGTTQNGRGIYVSSVTDVSGTFDNGYHDDNDIIQGLEYHVLKFRVDSSGNAYKAKGNDVDTFATKNDILWGKIRGTLSDQTDLMDMFGTKLNITPNNLNIGTLGVKLTQINSNSLSIGNNLTSFIPEISSGGSSPYIFKTQNKLTQHLFEFYHQNRLKIYADSSGNIFANGVQLGSGGGSTYTATLPIKVTGTVISADTAKHKGALSTFSDHQKDSALITANTAAINGKLSTSGTAANSNLLQGKDSSYIINNWKGYAINATYIDSIRFNNIITNYGTKTITTDINIVPGYINAKIGNGATISLVGDGIHQVSFNGFANYDPSVMFDNSLNMDNQVLFSCVPSASGAKFTYRIIRQTNSNSAPTANVTVTGTTSVGDTLKGHYIYDDLDGDKAGTPTIQWYNSLSLTGTYAPMSGETALTHKITSSDNYQYLKLGITPTAVTGTTPGLLSFCSPIRILGSLDADATAYLDSIGVPNDTTTYFRSTSYAVTGAEIRNALNAFVTGLKTDTLWTTFVKGKSLIYPFLTGDTIKDKINLIDPRKSYAAFMARFNGTITHTGKGPDPDGTTGWIDTHLNPNTANITSSSFHLCTYIQDNINISNSYDIQVNGSSANDITYIQANTQYYGQLMGSAAQTTYSNSDTRGLYIESRTSTTSEVSYKNGALKNSNTTSVTQAKANYNIVIFAKNNQGTIGSYTSRASSFVSIGGGFTQNQAQKYSARVNTLMTALHKNLY